MEDLIRELNINRINNYRNRKGLNILSLDWDFFTGDCQTKNRHCCGFCDPPDKKLGRGNYHKTEDKYKRIFYLRYEDFVKDIGHPLGLVVSECHADISWWISPMDYVVNLDVHNDKSDYGEVCCGSWAGGLSFYNHIPDEECFIEAKEDKELNDIDLIFLCQSSPWTPKKADDYFYKFIKYLASLCVYVEPVFFGHKAITLRNKYYMEGL